MGLVAMTSYLNNASLSVTLFVFVYITCDVFLLPIKEVFEYLLLRNNNNNNNNNNNYYNYYYYYMYNLNEQSPGIFNKV